MVDTLEILARAQAGAAGGVNNASAIGPVATADGSRRQSDPVILSEQAVLSLSSAQQATAAEAPAEADERSSARSVQAAINQTVNDLAWLFGVLSPPHVDSSVVMRAVAERASADGAGVNPPLSLFRAWAERNSETPALYVENLDVTASATGTLASVDRVTLTTIDPSLARSAPAVLDVGGEAAKLDGTAADDDAASLLIIRQGGQATAENVLRIRLDALRPLA